MEHVGHRVTGRFQALCGDRRRTLALAGALMAAIAAIGRVSAVEMSFLTFYWLPVALVTWSHGTGTGVAFSATGIAISFISDASGGRMWTHPLFAAWEIGSQTVSFAVFVALVAGLRDALDAAREGRRASEQTAKLKSSLVTLVNHEILNSVSVAQMAVALMQEKLGAPAQPHCSMLRRTLEHLQRTTRNFLTEARIEAGKYQLALRPVPVRTVVDGAAALFHPYLADRGVACSVDAGNGLMVEADEQALLLVLSNLLGNAFKYTRRGGRVDVRVRGADAGRVLVTVTDTGIGMGPDDLARVRDEFERLPAGQVLGSGFGVGLKVASDLLGLHGSRLEIESELGKGSRFSFDLARAA